MIGAPLVLVADDFADSREMYADFLAFSGFRVAAAKDGPEVLEKAVDLRPDLILRVNETVTWVHSAG